MSLEGWYSWNYQGGTFPVAFRPFGSFFCPQFQSQALWRLSNNKVELNWGSYGNYEFSIEDKPSGGPILNGCAVGNPSNWRKCEFIRPFSPAESLMFSGGSEWSFEWEKGAFPVEFRADGLNHFICNSFPAHAHWSMEGDKITIDWEKYGEYEMTLDASSRTMVGCKKGQPTNWRRATYIRSLGEEGITSMTGHDHSHSHVHDENCKH